MTKRVFIGIKNKTFTLKVREDETGKVFSFPTKAAKSSNRYEITLLALFDYLGTVNSGETIIYYANNDLLSFEWENEWKKEKKFSKQTKYPKLWENIAKRTVLKKIDLTIKGENTILSALNKL